MRKIIAAFIGILMTSFVAHAQGNAAGAARAEKVINEARAALGGETALKSVVSLSISGTFRRVAQEQERSGTVVYNYLIPDKFKRTETLSFIGKAEVTFVHAINGNEIWADSNSKSTGDNTRVMVMRPDSQIQKNKQGFLLAAREEFARIMLYFLLSPPPSFPVEFSYVGQAKAGDGHADVIDVKGPERFTARLFLDKKTHMPLMMTYRGVPPILKMTSKSIYSHNPEDKDKAIQEAQKLARNQASHPKQLTEIQVRFSDYRVEDGISFPHLITKAADGKVYEEMTVTSIKVNFPLAAENFQKKD